MAVNHILNFKFIPRKLLSGFIKKEPNINVKSYHI